MEPRIHYAKTSDGINIAFYAIGDGPPLLVLPAGLHQSIEFDWKVSNFRIAAEVSARTFTYIRYDPRGSGLSDREVGEFSLDSMVRDLEAVTSSFDFDRYRLFAPGEQGMSGVAFAALHPGKLSHLVTWVGGVKGRALSARHLPFRTLVESDWRIASETIIRTADVWDNADLARESAEIMRASVEPTTYLRYLEAVEKWDLSSRLSSITCPTLVIHPASNPYFAVARARELAATIPKARLALVETSSVLMPGMEVIRLAGRFFLDRPDRVPADTRPPRQPESVTQMGLTVILFADIADSTPLTERLGDKGFRAKARDLDTALRAIIRENSGICIDAKTLGDGVLATFNSAAKAIEAALACAGAGNEAGLPLHLGLHAGDVIREENNVFGGAVNIAARISALSTPSEVLVSDTVRSLARTSAGVTFGDRGEQALKGVGEPVRVYEVSWRA